MNLTVICPYCGFTQSREVDPSKPQLMTCDSDEGGCDKTFVVRASIRPTVDTYKIEGEE